MKVYVKPVLIGLLGILIFAAGVIFVMTMYNKYLESIQEAPAFVETQIDFNTIYEDADIDHIVTLYDGIRITDGSPIRYIGGKLYIPVDFVVKYLNDQFFYDPAEQTLTYTTGEDIIRMKTDDLTYTVNDEPLLLDIGMTDFDGITYLPLTLVQKFSHHDYIYNDEYFILRIEDWYGSITTGEVYYDDQVEDAVYIRTITDDESPYIHKTYIGMEIQIIGEDGLYYKIVTKEGFTGFIRKEFVRSISTLHSNTTPVPSPSQFPSNEYTGKLNLAWHQVFNSTANGQVAEKFAEVTDVDVISPTWFELTGTDGDVKSIADLDYVRWAHNNGYQVWALFGNLGEGYTKAMTHDVLSSTEKRMESIRQILAFSSIYELDGINIDFEAIPEADGPYFVQFCKEMAVYCKQQGLTISADFPVIKAWTRHYGQKELAQYLDYIMIMAYDEHWGSSPIAGSVASKTWIDEGIKYTLEQVPKEKVIVGIPFYTRLWKEETVDGEVKVSSKAYSMDYAVTIMDDHDVELVWLEDIGQYYGEYEEDGAIYKMWLEDVESVEMRMKIAADYDIGGVAAWKIGLENAAVWDVISKYMKP